MKKIYLFLLIFVFLAVSAFAGELIVGGGFFNMGPGGGGGAEYEMDASGGSIILTGLTGQSFTYSGTTRTYIDGDGVMQDAAINTPRVEADGLLLEPVGANIFLQSRNFNTTPWTGNTTNVQNETGVDGAANKAWTLTDDASSFESSTEQFQTLGSTGTFVASVFIKKSVSASTFPGFGISVAGVGVKYVTVDTDNGTLTDYSGGGPDDSGVIDTGGDFWRVWVAADVTGGTSTAVYLYPTVNADATGTWVGTVTGSCVFDAVQFEADSLTLSSYIDNDGVAEGAEQSSGNLIVGKSYRITATEVDYFYTGCAVNDYFIATAATALDASNKVTEFGTVRETEAAALTYDLPSDLFAETLGGEIASGTLPAGNLYKITATEVNNFYVGCAVGEYFTSVGTETCDANNKVQEVTNAYDSGDGLAPPHGTAIIWWKPGYDKADGGNNRMVTVSGQFLVHNIAGFPFTYDGVTIANIPLTYVQYTGYKLVVQWGYLTTNEAKYRMGYDSGSGVVWGTTASYDGAYIVGSNLELGDILADPHHNKRTQIYKQTLSDAEIDATPAP